MKVRLFLLSILCSVVTVVAISNSPTIQSQGKGDATGNTLSKDEQDLLTEINEARAHPDVYANYLEKLKPLFAGKVYKGTLKTQEGWKAVADAIAFLRTLKPQARSQCPRVCVRRPRPTCKIKVVRAPPVTRPAVQAR